MQYQNACFSDYWTKKERERGGDREKDRVKENPFTIIMTLMLSKINR